MGIGFDAFISILSSLLSIAIGIGGAPFIVNQIKQRFSLEGDRAFALSAVVALLFGVVTALAEGAITQDALTVDSIGRIMMIVWGASQYQYRQIRKQGSEAEMK